MLYFKELSNGTTHYTITQKGICNHVDMQTVVAFPIAYLLTM